MTKHELMLKQQRREERKQDKLRQQGTDTAINILQTLPLYILATEYGFGNIRLERFLRRLYNLTDQVAKDHSILHKICDCLEHDKGIRISFTGGENRAVNVWRDEDDTRKLVRGARKK